MKLNETKKGKMVKEENRSCLLQWVQILPVFTESSNKDLKIRFLLSL